MCVDPVTAMIAGGVLSGAGQIMTGVEQSKAAKIQAQMARQNSDLALAQGAYQEQEIRRDVAGVLGGQQSYFASSGLDPTVGSPVVLAANTAAKGEVDALLTRYGSRARCDRLPRRRSQLQTPSKAGDVLGHFRRRDHHAQRWYPGVPVAGAARNTVSRQGDGRGDETARRGLRRRLFRHQQPVRDQVICRHPSTSRKSLHLARAGCPSFSRPTLLGAVSVRWDRLFSAWARPPAGWRTITSSFATARKASRARAHYLKGLDDLQTKWTESPDFKNAPGEFASAETQLRQEALDMVSDPREREALGFDFERQSIAARGAVHGSARSNEASTAVANLDVADQSYFRRYGAAGSDAERQAIMGDRDKAIDGLANTGLLTPVQAQQRKLTFRATTEQGAVLELIRTDPTRAKSLLADPANFDAIDPFDRQRYLSSADAALEEQTLAGIRAGDDRSSLGAIGRVRDGGTATWIFDRGVIPQESGGRANAESPMGALGVAQLMPDTARGVARQMGLDDIAGLDDQGLKARLLSDPDLNRRIGLTYFQGLLDRYDGNVAVALAAYNAGPGNDNTPRATAWRDEAVRRFGPAFTAEEFASVIPVSETADYVRSVFGRLGQSTGSTLSATGRFRARKRLVRQTEVRQVG